MIFYYGVRLTFSDPEGIFKLLRSPGIDYKETIPPAYVACARIFKRLRSPGFRFRQAGNRFLGFLKGLWRAEPYSYSVPSPHRLL
jgi:hypothetical protein